MAHEDLLRRLPAGWLVPFHEVRELTWDESAGTGRVVAVRRNDLRDWFYDCHFQGDPVMPGCWGVDAVWQALRLFAAWRGLAGCDKPLGMEGVSFFGQIRPYDKEVVYAVDVVSVESEGGETLVTGKATVTVDGVQVYSIASAQVATAFWTDESPAAPTPGPDFVEEPAKKVTFAELAKKDRFSRAEVVGFSRGTLVDAPGEEVCLLPSGPMLEVGRVERISEEGIRASKTNAAGEWFYSLGPTKPQALSLDAVWQLCGMFLCWRGYRGIGRALGFDKLEVFGEVTPADKDLRYEVTVHRVTTTPGGDAFVRADARVLADGRLVLAVSNANVGCHRGIRYDDFPLPSAMSTGGKVKVRQEASN